MKRLIILSMLAYLINPGYIIGQCNSVCTGSNNYFGTNTGLLSSGSDNSFFGGHAGTSNSGSANSFFGTGTGTQNEGSENSFFGFEAGESNTTGTRNSFSGHQAGRDNTIGINNSFFGHGAGLRNTSGSDNSFFGTSCAPFQTTGKKNCFFGQSTGFNNLTGSFNSFFGKSAGARAKGSGNVIIGYGAGPSFGNEEVDLRLYIDVDTSSINGNDTPLIYGEFDNKFVRINGSFEVTGGLTNPSSKALKNQFTPVKYDEILEKLNDLSLQEWSYNHLPDIRHIGPIAEEFYAVFQLGKGDNTISTIDANGIALASIKAQQEIIENQEEMISTQQSEIKQLQQNQESLQEQIDALKKLIAPR